VTPRPRIAIIGGGVGSVTAAIQLSSQGWRARFRSITLYQQGWRLGGKGASGRGPGLRIEEHGLHIWFGFYENAFRMMDLCHQELDQLARKGQPRWPLAFTNVEDSFQPFGEISLTDHDGCDWKLWTADFFEFTDDRPWIQPDPRPPGARPDDWSVEYYAGRCLHLAADLAWSLLDSNQGLRLGAAPPAGITRQWESLDEAAGALWAALGGPIQGILRAAGGVFDRLSVEVVEESTVLQMLDLTFQGLQIVLDFLRGRYDRLVRAEDDVRRAWYVVDVMVALVRGLIEDGVIAAGSFDVVNGIDFREWLLAHGARDESADCALVRTVIYDLAFAYRGGDPQRPACEAGTALRGLLRTFFTYRGALMWKMNSGMGDTIFAPLYELLIKRGVEIRFFNRVEAVRAAGGKIREIEIDVQADVPAATKPRDYLRPGQPSARDEPALWPSDPSYLLSERGTRSINPIAPGVYESWFADPAQTRVGTHTLKLGARTDGFELVVFGLPISCVENIAPDLPARSRRWKAATEALETVPTQAVQLWLAKPATALCETDPGIVAGGFVEPFDTWADMHHLVSQERVDGSVTVAYFCNVLADSPAPPRGEADEWLAAQQEHVRQQALRFLSRDIASLWPRGTNPLTRELYWDLLVDPSDGRDEARLDAQFLRVNVEPSERYVLSVPGSSACRIAPDDTDFGNLYAVGDWTACTINAGCVEAAVISGMVAANGIFRAVGADTKQQTIIGRSGP
jgi:uncharacterized protein with NAD-binding domain and iron-sulfur cluster